MKSWLPIIGVGIALLLLLVGFMLTMAKPASFLGYALTILGFAAIFYSLERMRWPSDRRP